MVRPPRARPRLRAKLAVLGSSSLLGLAALEGACRALVPAPLEWRETPGKVLRFDPERGWALRPGARDFTVDEPVAINAEGFRDREGIPVERSPRARRIACVGDSYTYGWGVALEDSYPKQLERALARGQPTDVLNLGVFGYDGRQALATLRAIGLRYRPDVVLYGFYWDDLLPVRRDADEAAFQAKLERARSGPLRALLRRSRAQFIGVARARALRATLWPPATRFHACYGSLVRGDDAGVRDLWAAQGQVVCDLRDATASVGGTLVVVVWPLEARVLGRAPDCRFDETAAKLCAEAGVESVSLLEPLRALAREGKNPYLPYEQHPTPEAYGRCVPVIERRLRELGLAPSPRG